MTAWRSSNGWERVARELEAWPELEPFTYVMLIEWANIDPALNPEGAGASPTIQIDGDADFYCTDLTMSVVEDPERQGWQDGIWDESPESMRALILLLEETGGATFCNDWIHPGLFAGIGGRPGKLPVPKIWKAGTRITGRFHALFGGDVDTGQVLKQAWLCFHGFKRRLGTPPLPIQLLLDPRLVAPLEAYRAGGKIGRVEPFFYSVNFGPLPGAPDLGIAQQTQEDSFTVTDSEFLLLDWSVIQHVPSSQSSSYSYRFPPAGRVRFYVDAGELRLDDRPINLALQHGKAAKRPVRFPAPLILKPGQQFSVLYTQTERGDLTPRRENYFGFGGVRIFPPGARP